MIRKKRKIKSGKKSPGFQKKKGDLKVFSLVQKTDFLKRLSKRNIIIAAIVILVIMTWKFKGYFIVASVDGQPISRFQLTDQLIRRFGSQVLDNIINERLLIKATRQKGIFISKEEIEAKAKQIEERLKGQMSLAEAIKSQGLTENEFRKQIEIQLAIDKLFDKDASVSSTEIDDYYAKNKQAYKNATDPVAVREEIRTVIKQQKMSELFEKWFSELRKSADIKKSL